MITPLRFCFFRPTRHSTSYLNYLHNKAEIKLSDIIHFHYLASIATASEFRSVTQGYNQ